MNKKTNLNKNYNYENIQRLILFLQILISYNFSELLDKSYFKKNFFFS